MKLSGREQKQLKGISVRVQSSFTIEDLLEGKQVAHPRLLDATFKKAPRARKAAEEQMSLGGTEIDEPL